ncbi:hypothetical protein T265_03723 [Opisthorchis viverrini]|uniref:Uncharacterized protein n=1 Tax=Opisthorchis viverrini TaxID=6198 RepID=A0A074ZRK4_OPIVI|nr:hypothetical protein T265_03723 [Opisthorchis viverrini]KER29706.1 hypothetical protein T265_03723 [Opisthorchis viverrini]
MRDISFSVKGRVYNAAARSALLYGRCAPRTSKDFQCLTIDAFGALPESGGNAGSVILSEGLLSLIWCPHRDWDDDHVSTNFQGLDCSYLPLDFEEDVEAAEVDTVRGYFLALNAFFRGQI